MIKSTITSKHQVTIPRLVREQLGVGSGDVLVWDVREGRAQVSAATTAFLGRRGSVHVGPGSVVDDVARARRQRGSQG